MAWFRDRGSRSRSRDFKIDLFFNSHSFSEMKKEIFEDYISFIEKNNDCYLCSINQLNRNKDLSSLSAEDFIFDNTKAESEKELFELFNDVDFAELCIASSVKIKSLFGLFDQISTFSFSKTSCIIVGIKSGLLNSV